MSICERKALKEQYQRNEQRKYERTRTNKYRAANSKKTILL